MKAAVYTKYGPAEVLQLKEVEKPIPKDNEVLIKIFATTVTSRDWRFRIAEPFMARFFTGLLRPRITILGSDLAGEIEDIGEAVTLFKKGDQVFGTTDHHLGTYAEYKCMPEESILAKKPDNTSYEEAAAVFFGGHTALHFLRKANIKKGQALLIIGASGSVSSYGVQLAKYFKAKVMGVCSTSNLEMVKALGADLVIDYIHEDFTRHDKTYDIIFDTVGENSLSASIKSLKQNGIYLGTVLMTLPLMIQGLWTTMTSSKTVIGGSAGEHKEDLVFLKELIEAGHLKPVIDRCYPLEQIVEAHSYAEKGHKVLTVTSHRNETKQNRQ